LGVLLPLLRALTLYRAPLPKVTANSS
jgi:hypothetical protein